MALHRNIKKAYMEHPGKPGHVRLDWPGNRIGRRKRDIESIDPKLLPNGNRAAWIAARAKLDSSDLNALIVAAVESYKQ